jgi:hypothetical protein
MIYFLLLLVCSSLDCARAQMLQANQQTAVLQPIVRPQGFAVMDTARTVNQAYPGGYYPFNTTTSSNANWAFVAWSNPENIPYLNPFISFPTFGENQQLTGQTWLASSSQTASQNMAVIINQNFTAGTTSEIFLQDGLTNLSGCSDGQGNPIEYDFFAFPNSPNFNPYYPSAYLQSAANPPLNKVTGLNVKGSVGLLAQLSTSVPSRCPATQSSMIYSLIFNNTVTGQILFYQLDLNFFCYFGSDLDRNKWCSTVIPQMNYFFTGQGNVWGIDDPITNYVDPKTNAPYPLLQNTGTLNIDVNFMPRIAYLIQNAQYGMDNNLSHWQLGGIYYGQHTWGDAALVSNWSSANFAPTIVYSNVN